MAAWQKVTVDRSYFEALLRRADFHTSSLAGDVPLASANVSISSTEYDCLLQTSREHQLLKDALFQGGITEETLNLLISGSSSNDQRKDSGCPALPCLPTANKSASFGTSGPIGEASWRSNAPFRSGLASSHGPLHPNLGHHSQQHLALPSLQRQASYSMSSAGLDEGILEDDISFTADQSHFTTNHIDERRTIYFSGMSDRTTYRDLLSVIKGGRLLSINFRSERSATVSFLEGASDFLAWAKKNDIYLLSKRLEVKWADRQFQLHSHTSKKIANGATRNVVIRTAVEKGLTEAQIRADMEHIHNLVVVDVTFRDGDAYISMNSIHNALFAKTCMMSRATYKKCRIEFFPDECDVPLPVRTYAPRKASFAPKKKQQQTTLSNRFGLLELNGVERTSDEENRTPSDSESDDDGTQLGVSLDFLD